MKEDKKERKDERIFFVPNSITPSMFSSAREPKPPGIINVSMSLGAVSNVCVGTMLSPKLLFGGLDGVRLSRYGA